MLQRMIHDAPTDIAHIVFRMQHEMGLSEVLSDLMKHDWELRRLALAVQSYALEGRFTVVQLTEGCIGQHISFASDTTFVEYGHYWYTYSHEGWANDNWINDNIEKNYGTWKEDVGNGLIRVRLMLRWLPSLPDFEEFLYPDLYWNYFPGFIPVDVIMPARCVSSVAVSLDQVQRSIKYAFEEDLVFARAKVDAMAVAETLTAYDQHVMELMEFLIIKPSMLIHGPVLRGSINQIADNFMKNESNEDPVYMRHIYNLVERLSNVLDKIVDDPLYVAN